MVNTTTTLLQNALTCVPPTIMALWGAETQSICYGMVFPFTLNYTRKEAQTYDSV